MTKRIIALIMTVLLVLSMTACNDNSKPTNNDNDNKETDITFCLDWTPNTNHTGLYVALEKGYFKEAGINVSIVQPAESTSALMVASGEAQFGIEAQDTMAAALIGDSPLGITAVAAVL